MKILLLHWPSPTTTRCWPFTEEGVGGEEQPKSPIFRQLTQNHYFRPMGQAVGTAAAAATTAGSDVLYDRHREERRQGKSEDRGGSSSKNSPIQRLLPKLSMEIGMDSISISNGYLTFLDPSHISDTFTVAWFRYVDLLRDVRCVVVLGPYYEDSM